MADRVWAYAVSPTRTLAPEAAPQPLGGRVTPTEDLRAALQAAVARARESAWTSVVFRTKEMGEAPNRRRSNEARDALLSLAFAHEDAAEAASLTMAHRLGHAMDGRSAANLLVLSAGVEGDIGSVRLWTFPRDDAFKFDAGARPTIELLANVFSRTSGLRKAAQFDGESHDSSFIGGHALDFQTGSNSFDIADYWIGRFLDCRLGVTPVAGTQLVARAMKKLDATLTNPADRQTLTLAAVALRHSPRTNWTLNDVAQSFLPEGLREQLIASSDKPEMNDAPFSLSHDLFDGMVATRVFSLVSGVVVASPLSEVGDADEPTKPVVITGDQLHCEGTIAKERLRGRGGTPAA